MEIEEPLVVHKIRSQSHIDLFELFLISTMTTHFTLTVTALEPFLPGLDRVILVIAWVLAGPNCRAVSDLYSTCTVKIKVIPKIITFCQ